MNYQDAAAREIFAPDLSFANLDRAMHIRFANGRTLAGFSAFRALAWKLPLLWIVAPFLYIPGAKLIGDAVYARVAARRKQCSIKGHAGCGKDDDIEHQLRDLIGNVLRELSKK